MKKKKKIAVKRKITPGKRKSNTNTWHLLIKFAFAYCIVAAILTVSYVATSKNSVIRIASQEDSLQLETFYPTPTPTPTSPPVDICNHHDDGVPVDPSCICQWYFVHCENKTCKEVDMSKSRMQPPITCEDTHPPRFPSFDWCNYPTTAQTDGWFCLGKPVVYLYPVRPMYVDVSVVTPGNIVVSDPLYPEGGWKQVFAQPNGSLAYNDSYYRELFYESSVKDFAKPQNGINIPVNDLEPKLSGILTRLGLLQDEKQEFLEWWVPRLKALQKPYIQFSIIDPAEKEKIDHVEISPKPDTMIQFIAYFKGLPQPFTGTPLHLPSSPVQRIGFTAVEWGGTIDNK